MSADRPRSVGMAWYDRGAYAEIRRAMVDGHRMAETFEAWLASAEQVESEVARSGVAVVRVPIELGAFVAWCEQHGRACDGSARTAYANAAITTGGGAPG